MTDEQSKLQNLLQRLEQERDEMKVKIGLAKLEVREEWQEVEAKLEGLRGRMKRLKDEAEDATEDVGDALELVGDEIRDGFNRIRKLF